MTIPTIKQSDKVLHFITFFLLTVSSPVVEQVSVASSYVLQICFYWILETNRRRNLQLTIFVCTVVLGVGSEILQGLLPVSSRPASSLPELANHLDRMAAILIPGTSEQTSLVLYLVFSYQHGTISGC